MRACISREFTVWASGQSSPVVDWLRALAVFEHKRCGGPGVGAVGMCITGGFALAMATHPVVLVPVLSEPSLPMPVTSEQRRSIDIGLLVVVCPPDVADDRLRVNPARDVSALRQKHRRRRPAPTSSLSARG